MGLGNMKHFPHAAYFIPALLSGHKTIELRPHTKAEYLPAHRYYIGEDYMAAPAPKDLAPGMVYHISNQYTLLRRPSGHVYAIEPERVATHLAVAGVRYKAISMPPEIARIIVEIEAANGRPEILKMQDFPVEWLWQLGVPCIELVGGGRAYRDLFTGQPVEPIGALESLCERIYGIGRLGMLKIPHRVYYYRVEERQFPPIW